MLPAILLLLLSGCIREHKKTCCATDSFAGLAGDPAFVKAHASPVPMSVNLRGAMIQYPTPDGRFAHAYLLRDSLKSNRWIFVFHEWWGLNDHIKNTAQQLFDSLGSVNILALDLYDGRSTDDAQVAGKLMGGVVTGRADNIIQGALNYVGGQARVATLGWCFGGGWSLQAALLGKTQTAGCVMYYGMPEDDVEKLKTLHSDVLMIWADKDQWINQQVVDDFRVHMKAADKQLTVLEYPADHAFANPSNPHYDKASTADAWRHTLQYFRHQFQR